MEAIARPHTPKSLRVGLDLTQAEVAEKTGGRVTERTIYNLEAGKDVSLDSLRAIAKVYCVSEGELIAAIDTVRALRAGRAPRRKRG